MLMIFVFLTGCSKEEYYQSTDISKYEEYIDVVTHEKDYEFFPDLDSINSSNSTNIMYVERTGSLVRSKSLVLSITVPENNYLTLKDDYLAKYSYFSELILDSDNEPVISSNEFYYGTFTIFIIRNDDFDYPKNFGMIGYSDDRNEIIWLFYSDSDIDYIRDMSHFLEINFLMEE